MSSPQRVRGRRAPSRVASPSSTPLPCSPTATSSPSTPHSPRKLTPYSATLHPNRTATTAPPPQHNRTAEETEPTSQQQQTAKKTSLSRPVEDCEGCPALARIRSLGLDDPSAGRPDLHCNFGDRRIRACRSAASTQRQYFMQAVPAA